MIQRYNRNKWYKDLPCSAWLNDTNLCQSHMILQSAWPFTICKDIMDGYAEQISSMICQGKRIDSWIKFKY